MDVKIIPAILHRKKKKRRMMISTLQMKKKDTLKQCTLKEQGLSDLCFVFLLFSCLGFRSSEISNHREMLRSRSTKFIHKFSIACPAHIVATTMCFWFLMVLTIGFAIQVQMQFRLDAVEQTISIIKNNTSTIVV